MPQTQIVDDLGFRLELQSMPRRIISLVPSWTETLFALGIGDRLVGVTKFCVEPEKEVAPIAKIGGTKNPDLRAIANLHPDLSSPMPKRTGARTSKDARAGHRGFHYLSARPFPARSNRC